MLLGATRELLAVVPGVLAAIAIMAVSATYQQSPLPGGGRTNRRIVR
jgi:hypothetical protein